MQTAIHTKRELPNTRLYYGDEKLQVKNLLIISSAFGVDQSFYSQFAAYMARQGFTVVTFNYRHLDNKTNAKNLPELYVSLAADLEAVIDWLRSEFPEYTISILGHGIGSAIIALISNCKYVQAIINLGGRTNSYNGRTLWEFLNSTGFTILNQLRLSTNLGIRPIDAAMLTNDSELRKHRWYLRKASLDMGPRALKKSVTAKEFSGRMLTIRLHDDVVKYPEHKDPISNVFTNAKQSTRNLYPQDIETDYLGFFGSFLPKKGNAIWEMFHHWLLDRTKVTDFGYANFDDTHFPIVTITLSNRDPSGHMITEYFESMEYYLNKGPVYFLIDLTQVQWADSAMGKIADSWIRDHANLVRSMHRGTVYAAPNFFIRYFLIGFHLLQHNALIKPVQVFKTHDLAFKWLLLKIRNKEW